MKSPEFNRASHFSIVWGITLAVITLVEWHSLERDPVRQEIFSPFIGRNIVAMVENRAAPVQAVTDLIEPEDAPDAVLRYEVEFKFNGPLFLACFFGPILVFHAAGMLWSRYRGG